MFESICSQVTPYVSILIFERGQIGCIYTGIGVEHDVTMRNWDLETFVYNKLE